MALAEQDIAPHQVVIFTGIGCGSKLPHYMKVSGFHTPRVYKLEETDHNPTDKTAAWELACQWGERIPIGIFYRVEGVPTYEEQVSALKAGPLVKQPLEKLRPEQVEALRQEVI